MYSQEEQRNKIIKIVPFALILLVAFLHGCKNSVSALYYENPVDIQFTFNPSISIAVSGDLLIDRLAPGTYADSNTIRLTIATNNISGYNLSATVGNNANTTTDLSHNNSEIGSKFSSLSTEESYESFSNENIQPNSWGYSFSKDNGITWRNASSSTALGYSGLPIFTSSGVTISEYYHPTTDNIDFKIAAKAGNNQTSGEYSNTINFTATAIPGVRYYMHEFTKELCSVLASDNNYTVYDIRDGSDYTVRYINDNCWMTQNLRIAGAISSEYSNYDGEDINISEKDLDQTVGDCSWQGCDSYTVPMTHSSEEKEDGAWYNYCAASAKSVCAEETMEDASMDVCPKKWRLPTWSEIKWIGDNHEKRFNLTITGFYMQGIKFENQSRWWTSTAYGKKDSMALYYYSNDTFGNYSDWKANGLSVRCVLQ